MQAGAERKAEFSFEGFASMLKYVPDLQSVGKTCDPNYKALRGRYKRWGHLLSSNAAHEHL